MADRTQSKEEKVELLKEAIDYRLQRFMLRPNADNLALLRCNLLAYQELIQG